MFKILFSDSSDTNHESLLFRYKPLQLIVVPATRSESSGLRYLFKVVHTQTTTASGEITKVLPTLNHNASDIFRDSSDTNHNNLLYNTLPTFSA